MNIDLTGKTAIITGSTVGIGFAIAKGLAESGASVVLNGRSGTAVEKAVEALRSTLPNAGVRGVTADVGTAKGCAALREAEPSADILVNNVGIYGPQDFFETSDEEWTRFFEVNVMSGVRLSRALAKRMAGTAVTVNAVLPGPTLSEGLEAMLQEAKRESGLSIEQTAVAFVKENRPSSIIQRAATVEEVANLVVYASSPQASATTGAALRVDGGVVETIA